MAASKSRKASKTKRAANSNQGNSAAAKSAAKSAAKLKYAAAKDQVRTLKHKVAKLKAQALAADQSLPADLSMDAIPRPNGSAGDGYNLQDAMGLYDHPELYRSIRRTVRSIVQGAHLDHRVLWFRQPTDKLAKILAVAHKRQPYLKRFPHGWATEEFIKSYLKNKRSYCKKMGYDNSESDAASNNDCTMDSENDDEDGDDEDNGGDDEDNGAPSSDDPDVEGNCSD